MITLSKEQKQKISDTLKKKYSSGNITHWLKGKKGYTNNGSFIKGHKINLNKKMNPESIKKSVLTRKMRGSYNNQKNIERCFGKTYEEIYGKEKAQIIKTRIGMKSIGRIPVNKGKKYEELYEESVAKELKNKIKEARKNQIFPKNDTQIEIKIQNYLKELNIEFFTHYYTKEINHAYQCDILIPVQNNINKKTIIECDGDYWHGNPNKYILPNEFQLKQIEEDKTRTEELIDQGFRVIRLWESDIKQLNINTFQIIL